MLTVIVFAISVPVAAGLAVVALGHRLSHLTADHRGIALQTVIIMVVLLAVAGAVAGVLLARGGEAVSEVERQEITRGASEFTNNRLCEAYGFSWDGPTASGTCKDPAATPVIPPHAVSTHTDQASCETTGHGHTWNLDPAGDGSQPAACQ